MASAICTTVASVDFFALLYLRVVCRDAVADDGVDPIALGHVATDQGSGLSTSWSMALPMSCSRPPFFDWGTLAPIAIRLVAPGGQGEPVHQAAERPRRPSRPSATRRVRATAADGSRAAVSRAACRRRRAGRAAPSRRPHRGSSSSSRSREAAERVGPRSSRRLDRRTPAGRGRDRSAPTRAAGRPRPAERAEDRAAAERTGAGVVLDGPRERSAASGELMSPRM